MPRGLPGSPLCSVKSTNVYCVGPVICRSTAVATPVKRIYGDSTPKRRAIVKRAGSRKHSRSVHLLRGSADSENNERKPQPSVVKLSA